MQHLSVLLKEAVDMIGPKNGGVYFDGTLGGGGHTEEILKRSAPSGKVAGTDLDSGVIKNLTEKLGYYGDRVALFNCNFSEIDRISLIMNYPEFDGILLDLGMSSIALDNPERGLSFMHDGPLDMRFSDKNPLSAATVVNDYSPAELTRILKVYGEERFAGRIAAAIITARPLNSTRQLAEIVAGAIPRKYWPKEKHPATRTFQAIRIEVNHELEELQAFLPKAAGLLKVGGVMSIITFHSLEDRIVKRFLAGNPENKIELRRLPVEPVSDRPRFQKLSGKPVIPSEQEIDANPRARSAKLRAARRVA